MILVSLDPQSGTLRRYAKDSGAESVRLTHRWQSRVTPCVFSEAVIREFYESPADCDKPNVSAYTPAYDYPPCA